MFLSFDPLVCLLNCLQVLEMHLHQPINLDNNETEADSERKQQDNKKNIRGKENVWEIDQNEIWRRRKYQDIRQMLSYHDTHMRGEAIF